MPPTTKGKRSIVKIFIFKILSLGRNHPFLRIIHTSHDIPRVTSPCLIYLFGPEYQLNFQR